MVIDVARPIAGKVHAIDLGRLAEVGWASLIKLEYLPRAERLRQLGNR